MNQRIRNAQEFMRSGRSGQAEALLLHALRSDPSDAAACSLMVALLAGQGRLDQAEHYARRALALAPQRAAPHANLANIVGMAGRLDEAVESLLRARQLAPADPGPLTLLAQLLTKLERLDEADAACREGLALKPDDHTLLLLLSTVLVQSGRSDEAVAILGSLSSRNPSDETIAGRLAATCTYCPSVTPQRSAAAHRRFGALISARAAAGSQPTVPLHTDRDPDRPLRVGLVSADLRLHSMAFFVEPLLAGRPRDQVHIHCYSTTPREDTVSERLRALADGWTHTPNPKPHELCDRIRADRIDILIDLSGCTTGHSLHAMALRAAPVQATWLGYPNTTGIAAIDYRLADSLTDPPGSEPLTAERLIRLDPHYQCYSPPAATEHLAAPSPPSQTPGSEHEGRITFGAFSALYKLNDFTIALWAAVLLATPSSRLIVKHLGLKHPGVRAALAGRFARAAAQQGGGGSGGIDPSRLLILGPDATVEHSLAQYRRIDIALDTFPYAGTTTTCEALCMGVPMITLAGGSSASRVGLSILSSVGLPDLVAHNPEQFPLVAARLAADAPRLAELRRTLRSKFVSSPVGDAAAFGARFAAKLRSMWHTGPRP